MTERAPDAEALTRRHREMLIVTLVILAGVFLLSLRDDGRVAVAGFPALTLPPLCQSYAIFGVRCPGCGLTRSFLSLGRGDLSASWGYHRLGWLLALVLLVQLPYRILSLRHPQRAPLGPKATRLFAWFLITLLVLNWVLDLALSP